MIFDPPLVHGALIKRYKRFLADVQLADGSIVTAHCPNPGSMRTCAEPGWGARLTPSNNPKRKLKWTLEVIDANDVPILVNTARPNAIVCEGIEQNKIPELYGYEALKREVKYGENSRIDVLLSAPERRDCYVEIKNVTMAAGEQSVAFPDSVSKRAAKHMRELSDMVRCGHRAVVFFLVSRADAKTMRPAHEIDPHYAEALRDAHNQGVEVLAYRLDFGQNEVSVGASIPVLL
jgi:sugar fermentation stimulation protein A